MIRTLLVVAALLVVAVLVFAGPEPKVTICHYPPGHDGEKVLIITVGASAVDAHVALHGDYVPGPGWNGICDVEGIGPR